MNTGTAPGKKTVKALFIADVHLAEARPKTTAAFLDFVAGEASQSERLYILGDLFEYWAGDDDIEAPFNRQILNAIKALGDTGTAVYWVPGNRDFLTGDAFARESGATLLPDLHAFVIGNHTIAVGHGDAQCLGDPDYVKFRMMVRNPQWQQQFLAMPLPQRKQLIESFRKDSHEENESKPQSVWDVTPSAIDAAFAETGATVLIHGHTHRPGIHEHAAGKRYVLPDWELEGDTRRGGWLALNADNSLVVHDIA